MITRDEWRRDLESFGLSMKFAYLSQRAAWQDQMRESEQAAQISNWWLGHVQNLQHASTWWEWCMSRPEGRA